MNINGDMLANITILQIASETQAIVVYSFFQVVRPKMSFFIVRF